MIEITLKSNTTGRILKKDYTARELLDKEEITILEEMTVCGCEILPRSETNLVECNCEDEWIDYKILLNNKK